MAGMERSDFVLPRGMSRQSFLKAAGTLALLPLPALAARSQSGAARLDLATASRLIGTTFRATGDAGRMTLVLRTVTDLSATAGRQGIARGDEVFVLSFDHAGGARLPEGAYAIRHPALQEFLMFVSCTGRGASTARYTAVFNRLGREV